MQAQSKQWHHPKKHKLKVARQNAALGPSPSAGSPVPLGGGNPVDVQDAPMDIAGGAGADGDKKIIIEDFVEVKPNVLNDEPVKVSDPSLLPLSQL